MPIGLRRDPILRQLSPRAWDAYTSAAFDVGEFETDGFISGTLSAGLRECLKAGAILEEDGRFRLYRWRDLMPSRGDLEQRREEAKARKARWAASRSSSKKETRNASKDGERTRSKRVPDAFGSNSPSLSNSNSRSKNGSQLTPVTGSRDLTYEAFGDAWQGGWRGLPTEARGRINDALGSLRNMTENRELPDADLAEQVRIRWARGLEWQPEWEWTPQTLLRYWRRLASPVATRSKSDERGERIVKAVLG